MGAAGLTRGGFYNHFASKDALVATVLATAMANGAGILDRAITAAQERGDDPLSERIDWYLSPEHRADVEHGCPNASFAGDARRLDPSPAPATATGLAENLDRLTQIVPTSGLSDDGRRARAIALFSEMVGALLLARAVADADQPSPTKSSKAPAPDLHNRTGAAR